MKLTLTNNRYVLQSTFDERMVPKAAGFRWDPAARCWWTDQRERAAKLAEHADATCATDLATVANAAAQAKALSRAVDAQFDAPAPEGLAYRAFQRAGIAYASARPATLIADEPGLGKTIQAIGVVNADPSITEVLVVCPAHLRLNWRNELRRWMVRRATIVVAEAKSVPSFEHPAGTVLVVIAHYEAMTRHADLLRGRTWDLLVADEAHFVKNPKAQRTRALLGSREYKKPPTPGIAARRRILMTGTPIVNRPLELWTLLSALDPDRWNHFFRYAKRYCDAHEVPAGRKMVWDFTGASNLDELQDILRSTLMVRRLKSEVLTELPAKTRQVIELPANGAAGAVERERERIASLGQRHHLPYGPLTGLTGDEYANAVLALQEGSVAAFTEISLVRHETAMAKVPAVIEHLKDAMEEHAKLVVFCHHHDVAHALTDGLAEFGVAVATGESSVEARTEAVRRFQEDPAVRVMVASIMGAGTGFTMTAASLAVFAELPWTPGDLTQAEDRIHRIGQTAAVLIQHLVLEGSLDAHMARVLVAKQAVATSALDTEHADRVAQAQALVVSQRLERLGQALHDAAVYAQVAARRAQDGASEAQARQAMTEAMDKVPEGYYAIASATGNNDLDFFRVDRPTEGRWAGRVFVKRVIGGRPSQAVHWNSIPTILARIADAGPREAMALFGRELGKCGRCGRHLTDDESRAVGLGPVCAGLA